ncbi:hypothetical protein E1263_11080 [Kribbella antibiotica]|uniref:Uncharacterized protein n=1 Tax=Kribbella antibiotica TaxID=190195 RepID=A0A4R4ZNN4_9ACTN|nr:hypothetical protein [Kribbella antibiotica]TDD60463.1 hypothetical protein E1263_11080 [Kribbella antibiotica]
MGKTLNAWADLLDRSLEQIEEISADTRNFDRAAFSRLGNIWDNSCYAFVHTTCVHGAVRREVAARLDVRWMLEQESERYRWAVEQAAATGHRIALPAPRYADRAGSERVALFSAEAIDELAAEFVLETARATRFTVERSRGRLKCVAWVELERRSESEVKHALWLEFDSVEALQFDLSDNQGIRLDWHDGKLQVTIGDHGTIHATSGRVSLGGTTWLLPAEPVVLLRTVRYQARPKGILTALTKGGRLPPTAQRAALLLRNAMLVVRGAGSLERLHTLPTHELAHTFAEAGSDLLSAGTSFRRDAAFQRLLDKWLAAASPRVLPHLKSTELTAFPDALPQPVGPPDPQSQLLLADFSTAFDYGFAGADHPSPATTGTLILGAPDHQTLRRIRVDDPERFAVRIEAFGTTLGAAQRDGSVALG